jgi:hypothetical protein
LTSTLRDVINPKDARRSCHVSCVWHFERQARNIAAHLPHIGASHLASSPLLSSSSSSKSIQSSPLDSSNGNMSIQVVPVARMRVPIVPTAAPSRPIDLTQDDHNDVSTDINGDIKQQSSRPNKHVIFLDDDDTDPILLPSLSSISSSQQIDQTLLPLPMPLRVSRLKRKAALDHDGDDVNDGDDNNHMNINDPLEKKDPIDVTISSPVAVDDSKTGVSSSLSAAAVEATTTTTGHNDDESPPLSRARNKRNKRIPTLPDPDNDNNCNMNENNDDHVSSDNNNEVRIQSSRLTIPSTTNSPMISSSTLSVTPSRRAFTLISDDDNDSDDVCEVKRSNSNSSTKQQASVAATHAVAQPPSPSTPTVTSSSLHGNKRQRIPDDEDDHDNTNHSEPIVTTPLRSGNGSNNSNSKGSRVAKWRRPKTPKLALKSWGRLRTEVPTGNSFHPNMPTSFRHSMPLRLD